MKLFLREIFFNFLPSPIKILYFLQILTQMLVLLKFLETPAWNVIRPTLYI